jgi:hypothetical protein
MKFELLKGVLAVPAKSRKEARKIVWLIEHFRRGCSLAKAAENA